MSNESLCVIHFAGTWSLFQMTNEVIWKKWKMFRKSPKQRKEEPIRGEVMTLLGKSQREPSLHRWTKEKKRTRKIVCCRFRYLLSWQQWQPQVYQPRYLRSEEQKKRMTDIFLAENRSFCAGSPGNYSLFLLSFFWRRTVIFSSYLLRLNFGIGGSWWSHSVFMFPHLNFSLFSIVMYKYVIIESDCGLDLHSCYCW